MDRIVMEVKKPKKISKNDFFWFFGLCSCCGRAFHRLSDGG